MHNYLDLKIWQRSRDLVKLIYQLTDAFPKNQQFSLVNQMQRAVVSIPSNIAEGVGRNSDREFVHFLDIANGSAFELETQVFLSFDLGYIKNDELDALVSELKEIQKMIYKFRNNLVEALDA
jgi:four helix bundle protein